MIKKGKNNGRNLLNLFITASSYLYSTTIFSIITLYAEEAYIFVYIAQYIYILYIHLSAAGILYTEISFHRRRGGQGV
ncbi:hypothetical protein D3Z45_21500 [Lachnospiraceae bacterium]|nr:hypothetical protein [Lachnospiraceae bacterium]